MRRSPLLAVFLTVVIDLLGFGLILPLLPLYAEEFHASGMTIGLLFASFSGMQFVFAPLWGRLSDRIGRRPVIIVGLCGSVLSYTLFALAHTLPHPIAVLFISRITAGLFGGTITTAYAYIADVTPPNERGRGMALIGAAFGIGFTFGPAVGGLGDHYLGHMGPGFIAAGFSLVALASAIFRLPEPERHVHGEGRRWLEFGSLRRACRIPGVGALLLVAFLVTFSFALFESTLALLAKERFEGWTPRSNGFLFSYIGLWLTLAQGYFVRRYMRRIGERRFTIAGTVLLACGLVSIGYAPSPVLLAALAPLAVFGFAMVTPSVSSLISLRTDPGRQGEILGVNQSMQSLARIVGPVAGNVLLVAGTHLPYWAGAGVVAVGLAAALRLPRTFDASDAPATETPRTG